MSVDAACTSSPHPAFTTSASQLPSCAGCRMVAGFASGFAFSLVSGVAPQSGPSLQAAFSSGVVFAVFQGGIYAVRLHSGSLQSTPAGGSSISLGHTQLLSEPDF